MKIPTFLTLCLLLAPILMPGQQASAPLEVVVTDMQGKARKGEKILFTSETDGKVYSGISGNTGTFTLEVPAGQTYRIDIAAIGEDLEYTTFEIPSLEPGQYFSSNIVLTIQFEPAKLFTLDNVHFDTGKSSIRPSSYPELDELYEYLNLKEEVVIEIAGHTDDVGDDADNLALSQARAEAVRTYLVKKGIGASRIRATGYGETRPVASNETPEGRQMNRRTEVVIVSE